jgi:hypothetical protein
MHWFDRISIRAVDGEPRFNRRAAVKGAAAAAVAASPLGSPLLAGAASDLRRRQSACACQAEADRVAIEHNNTLLKTFALGGFLSGFGLVIVTAGLAGTLAGWVASKEGCGKCRSNPSGGLSGGGGGGTPCRALGGVCPGPGPSCPPGTSPCSDGLCCFGSDICCACGANAQCCIVEVGCACC